MKLKSKLASYSALAVAIVSKTSDSNAQIVYEDIDPDIYIEVDYDIEYLDLNYDGVDDFKFSGVSFYFSSAGVLDTYYIHIDALGSNRVAYFVENQNFNLDCYSSYWSTALSYSVFCNANVVEGKYVTPVMEFGTVIDSASFDFRTGSLILGDESETGFFGTFETEFCPVEYCFVDDAYQPTYGPWSYGTHDAYVGVQLSVDGAMHNGYIHVYTYNASSNNGYAYIKDYGYNMIPDAPIFAGDTMNCGIPEITATVITPTGFKLFFDESDGTNQYKVRYREVGAGAWEKANNTLPHVMVGGLDCNTAYEYKYKVVCGMDAIIKDSGWSDVGIINTSDCRLSYTAADIQAKISPNPTGSTFKIESFLGVHPAEVVIRNTSGQTVRAFTNRETSEFSVQDLPSGIYTVTMRWDEITVTEMLVIER